MKPTPPRGRKCRSSQQVISVEQPKYEATAGQSSKRASPSTKMLHQILKNAKNAKVKLMLPKLTGHASQVIQI